MHSSATTPGTPSTPRSGLQRVLLAPFEDARGYRIETLRRDALAGLSVSVVAVPQSLAYAVIAGVPPEVGVYTLIVQGALGALLCSQRFVSSGPINTQSLLVAAVATRVLGTDGGPETTALYLELVVGLTLLKGLLQIALAAGGLGNLVRYVSSSVILGFTAGAGVLIAGGQLGSFLGIERAASASAWPGLVGILQYPLQHLDEARWPSVAVGCGSLIVVVALRRLSRLAPGPLAAVALGGVVVALTGWTSADLPLVPELPAGLPSFSLPSLSAAQIEPLLGGAFALSVLGLMETWSIGKTLSARTGQRISANHELLGQGLTNLASAFFGCIPGSGSFSRSALNFRAGAATRYAGLFNSGFAAAILLLFAPLAALIPLASLAAVLFTIAYDLIDWRTIRRVVRTSRSDASVCLATFAATLTIPLVYALFLGVLLNIALYLRRASRLHLAEMVSHGDDPERPQFIERPLVPAGEVDEDAQQAVVFLQLQGDLFFGLADELEARLSELAASRTRVVIIRLKRTLSIDSTVLAVFERFAAAMADVGGHVILCGVHPELTTTLRAYGIIDRIGEDCFFEATPGVFASAERALERARQLAGQHPGFDRLTPADLGDTDVREDR